MKFWRTTSITKNFLFSFNLKSPITFLRHKSLKIKTSEENSLTTQLEQLPDYINHRNELWNKHMTKHETFIAEKIRKAIKIKLIDGKITSGESWTTTPHQIALEISKNLAENSIVAKVNGQLWDLDRPLEENCSLQILKFENDEARQVFWHSTAHILGEALERLYFGHLCYGPPIENGFYYDIDIKQRNLSNSDLPVIENEMKKIINEKQFFQRLEMSKEDLMEMFKYNKFKLEVLKHKMHTQTTTVYKCGTLIDLCLGPHVRNTSKIKAFSLTKNSSSNKTIDDKMTSLQRVYGISFPDTKQLNNWTKIQEEAAKRDHRKIGQDQELFFFSDLSPRSCFFQPHGTRIYNTLIEFLRNEYKKRDYDEVITPNIYNSKLWQISGHSEHFADNMFTLNSGKDTFALKPMNCPAHCLIFNHRPRSFRELPLRLADFGVLHRNELSGSGLTRVQRFQQDDAHIFCTEDQINDEINGCLHFLSYVYGVFGFNYELHLATRPQKYLGEMEMWEKAEKQLTESLNTFGHDWQLNEEDGAFYGPKIDIYIKDAFNRRIQCATIQLDFQLPIRFDLNYVNDLEEKKRPVMIHRAIFGSIERMIAILTENFSGKWPFWLSPRQVIIVPVASKFDSYAQNVRDEIQKAGFVCDLNLDSGTSFNRKIRNSQLAQYNFILVVGEKESIANTVNVRTRDNKIHGERSLCEVIEKFKKLKQEKILKSEDEF